MTLRTVQMASATSVVVLFLTLATTRWDGPSAFIRTAAKWAAGKSLPGSFAGEASNPRTTLSGTCNEDAASFATCEAPVAHPLQAAIPAILESPAMMPSAIFAETPNAIDTRSSSYLCVASIDAKKTDVEDNLTPPAVSCCGKAEDPAPGAAGAAPGTSGCSCDPKECKCT